MGWSQCIEKYTGLHNAIIKLEELRHHSFETKHYKSKERVAPINIGTIKAGQWHSTVPESIIAEGRLGVFPNESNEEARKNFEDHVFEFSKSDSWLTENPPEIEWFEGQFESGQTPIDDPLIKELSSVYKNVLNREAVIEGVTYGSDLRLFTNHAHIPSVLFGPGDVRLAHAANEYVTIEEIMFSTEVIANMIINWCGGSFE
tara:strand:- start:445 stop:1050 length:606 start_codon:yes stop_codon:yes gene_type:complete